MLFKLDIGFYGLAAEAITEAAFVLLSTESGDRAGLVMARIGLLFGGVAAVIVPVVVLIAVAVPPGMVFEQIIWFPFTGFAGARGLTPPPLVPPWPASMDAWTYFVALHHSVRFYFPLAILILGAGCAVASLRRRPSNGWALAFLTVLGACLLGYAAVRPDLGHIVPAWIPALILFVAFTTRIGGAVRWLRATIVIVVGLVFVVPSLWLKAVVWLHLVFGPLPTTFDIPRARGIVIPAGLSSLQSTVLELQAVVPPGEPIFVGNTRHDRIFVNDVMFYFLAERPIATRYHELHPGVATRRDVQIEIVTELERHRAKWIVLRRDRRVEEGGELSVLPAGAKDLDDYIRAAYVPVREFGTYGLWRRR